MKFAPLALTVGSMVVLALFDMTPVSALHTGIIGEAQAIVGAPLTPVSVAGVARRTTRRAVAVGTTAAVATTAVAAPQAQPAAAPPPPPAPVQMAAAPLAVGTVVKALPPGCVSAPISNVEYYLCNGTYYRPGFQGNNLVYVVQKP